MSDIFIRNTAEVENITNQMKADGSSKFCVIADWNKTFTTAFMDGAATPSSFSLIRNGSYLASEYNVEANKLFDLYHPIEVDPDVDLTEKSQKMSEWWRKHLELIAMYGATQNTFSQIASSRPFELREDSRGSLKALAENSIPLIIVSGGLGDITLEYLKRENLLTPNIVILSNLYEFDNSGAIVRVPEFVVHPFNKHEVVGNSSDLVHNLADKTNILLIGDSEDDLEMTSSFPASNVLKVGFFNSGSTEKQKLFKSKFDVVLSGDGSMRYVADLINAVLKNK